MPSVIIEKAAKLPDTIRRKTQNNEQLERNGYSPHFAMKLPTSAFYSLRKLTYILERQTRACLSYGHATTQQQQHRHIPFRRHPHTQNNILLYDNTHPTAKFSHSAAAHSSHAYTARHHHKHTTQPTPPTALSHRSALEKGNHCCRKTVGASAGAPGRAVPRVRPCVA